MFTVGFVEDNRDTVIKYFDTYWPVLTFCVPYAFIPFKKSIDISRQLELSDNGSLLNCETYEIISPQNAEKGNEEVSKDE